MNLIRVPGRLINTCLSLFGCKIVRQPRSYPVGVSPSRQDNLARLGNDVHTRLSKGEIIKIHVGCGPRILKGWLNIDLSYAPYQDYMKYYTEKYYPAEIRGSPSDFYAIDLTKGPLPIPGDTVDVIFHEDFIEHLCQDDQVLFLAESCRILRSGGVHRVNTPNLLASLREKHNFLKGYGGVYRDAWHKHGHLNILTPHLLEDLAYWVGYSNVIFNQKNQSTSKLIPLEYRPDPKDAPEKESIFADLVK